MITTGIKFVQRANCWCVYSNRHEEGKANEIFWFHTEDEAQAKLIEIRAKA